MSVHRRRPGATCAGAFPAMVLTTALVLTLACGPDPQSIGPFEAGIPAHDHSAAHLVVNSTADPGTGGCTSGECTLREAIEAANADFDANEISFAKRLPGVITLAPPLAGGGELVISHDLVISGPSSGIVIQRNAADPDFRIFRIGEGVSGPTVRFARMTIQGGRMSAEFGGGVLNSGDLTLANSTVRGNAAGGGGGIANIRDLTVVSSTISGNSAGDLGGGGIANFTSDANFTASNSTISGNTVTGSTGRGGGGIYTVGVLTLEATTVSGNSAELAGGGIALDASQSVGGVATVTNSTLSGNSAGTVGGGIHIFGDNAFVVRLALTNATVVGNSAGTEGGGFKYAAAAQIAVISNIFALNTAPTAPDFSGGPPVFGSHIARSNLLGIGGGSGISDGVDGNRVGTASLPIDPRLGALANNGGPTKTYSLKQGSPAVDAASTFHCPSVDQRGVSRPQGDVCDIGSYEREVRGGR